jgi:hypothetical protein
LPVLVFDGKFPVTFGIDDWHELCPPIHHSVGFGEKTMASDIESVSIVTDRARDASYTITGFEHNRANRRSSAKLQRRCQTGWPGTNNYCSFLSSGHES